LESILVRAGAALSKLAVWTWPRKLEARSPGHALVNRTEVVTMIGAGTGTGTAKKAAEAFAPAACCHPVHATDRQMNRRKVAAADSWTELIDSSSLSFSNSPQRPEWW